MAKKVITVPANIERSAPDGFVTYRSLDTNTSQNKNLPNTLEAIVDEAYSTDNVFDEFVKIENSEKLKELMSELIIRFDTKPDYYTKKDYQFLIAVLTGGLSYLYTNQDALDPIRDDLENLTAEFKIFYETVVKHINEQADINSSVLGELKALLEKVESISKISSELEQRIVDLENKECVSYIGGSGININEDEISAVLTEDISVSRVNIGSYTHGMKIEKGEKIVDILKNLLTSIIEMTPVAPKVTYSITPSQNVEYGASVEVTEKVTFTQGYYTDRSGNVSNIDMSCRLGQIDADWTVTDNIETRIKTITVVAPESFPKTSLTVPHSDDKTYLVYQEKDPSLKFTPYTGTELIIPANRITISPYFNAYIGYSDFKGMDEAAQKKRIEDMIKEDFTPCVKLSGDSHTCTDKYQSTSEKNALIITCPVEYKLEYVIDPALPTSNILPQFTVTGKRYLECGGGKQHEYKYYAVPATAGTVSVTNIKFIKEA